MPPRRRPDGFNCHGAVGRMLMRPSTSPSSAMGFGFAIPSAGFKPPRNFKPEALQACHFLQLQAPDFNAPGLAATLAARGAFLCGTGAPNRQQTWRRLGLMPRRLLSQSPGSSLDP